MEHLFALDSATNEWVSAATCARADRYVCWCPDKHPVFVRKPSGKEGVRAITAHFSHHAESACRKGGESAEHVNAKMALQTMAGLFSFVTTRCPQCKKETVEDCGDGTVVLELRSDDRKWRYDAVYTDARGAATALEVFRSHATTDEKIQSTRSSGMRIAEFSAESILRLAETGVGGRLDNLVVQAEICSAACGKLAAAKEAKALVAAACARQVVQAGIRSAACGKLAAAEEAKALVAAACARQEIHLRLELEQREARRAGAAEQVRDSHLGQTLPAVDDQVVERHRAAWAKSMERHRSVCRCARMLLPRHVE